MLREEQLKNGYQQQKNGYQQRKNGYQKLKHGYWSKARQIIATDLGVW